MSQPGETFPALNYRGFVVAEPTDPGRDVVEVWVQVGGVESRTLQLAPDTARRVANDLLLRADLADNGDDDGHGPWFYLEDGVLCSCRHLVDQDERCTRPRGPRAKFDARMGALFDAADALLDFLDGPAAEASAPPSALLDDLRAARNALSDPPRDITTAALSAETGA